MFSRNVLRSQGAKNRTPGQRVLIRIGYRWKQQLAEERLPSARGSTLSANQAGYPDHD